MGCFVSCIAEVNKHTKTVSPSSNILLTPDIRKGWTTEKTHKNPQWPNFTFTSVNERWGELKDYSNNFTLTLISLRNTRDSVTWAPKFCKNRASMDSGSLRCYITTNTFVVCRATRNSSVPHDFGIRKRYHWKKSFNVQCVLNWTSFEMECLWMGIELFVFCILTWQLCFFGFRWEDTKAFCLFSLCSSTQKHTHTYTHCPLLKVNPAAMSLESLKTFKCSREKKNWLWMVEVCGNKNSILWCLLRKANEI